MIADSWALRPWTLVQIRVLRCHVPKGTRRTWHAEGPRFPSPGACLTETFLIHLCSILAPGQTLYLHKWNSLEEFLASFGDRQVHKSAEVHLSLVAVESSTGRCGHRAGSENVWRKTRRLQAGFGSVSRSLIVGRDIPSRRNSCIKG